MNFLEESQVSPYSMTNCGTEKTKKNYVSTTLKKPQVDVPQVDRDGGP